MKKRALPECRDERGRQNKSRGDEDKSKKVAEQASVDDDAHNQGFGDWLRSSDGVELMRLFVIANSLVVFVTMAWPSMQEALLIVRDFFTGNEEDDY